MILKSTGFVAIPMLAGLLAASPLAQAAEIPIFSTGVDNSSVALAPGSADPHYSWELGSGNYFDLSYLSNYNGATFAGTTAYVPFTNWWGLGGPSSAPISFNTDGESGYVPFTYRTSFELSYLNPATASIDLSFYADDGGEIALNGTLLPSTFVHYQGGPTEFVISGGFVAGLNTLDFVTFNEGGPGGIFVQINSATAAPEPASLVLLGTGLAGLVFARRRKAA